MTHSCHDLALPKLFSVPFYCLRTVCCFWVEVASYISKDTAQAAAAAARDEPLLLLHFVVNLHESTAGVSETDSSRCALFAQTVHL